MNKKLIERLYDASARVGRIIHIPSMVAADTESQDSGVEDFLFDDLDEQTLCRLDETIPGLKGCVEQAWKEYEEGDRGRTGRGLYLEYVADFLARRSPVDFIVQVQWQVQTYHRCGTRFPLGSLSSGWGFYSSCWYAGKSIAACIQQGIRDARAEARENWSKAPAEMPVSLDEEE